jgi:putative Holliday junction resolvase
MQMKYLGIDFGSKRIGLAISDESGSFAFPLSVIKNSENAMSEIQQVCLEKNIGAVVIGDSENFQMQKNHIMEQVEPFVENLRKVSGLPVFLHPEFMTSQEAERLQGKNDMLDASAAAIILKSFLEITNNRK